MFFSRGYVIYNIIQAICNSNLYIHLKSFVFIPAQRVGDQKDVEKTSFEIIPLVPKYITRPKTTFYFCAMKIEKDENRKLNKLLRTQLATIKINFHEKYFSRDAHNSQKSNVPDIVSSLSNERQDQNQDHKFRTLII